MQAWKEEQDRLLEEEQLKEEKKGKKENLGGKKKGQEIHEEGKGSNKKSSKEKFKDEPAKVPDLEEDPSIPEQHSEKVYKVRNHIIAPCQESANYLCRDSRLQQSYYLL